MACVFFEQGLDAPTILLVKGPKVLNYLVDNGINIDEIDVGGMGARRIGPFYIKIFQQTVKKRNNLMSSWTKR